MPSIVHLERGKRGPHTRGTDDDLVVAIRTMLAETPFHGEGHRKVRVRLRASGWQVGKNRVLRVRSGPELCDPMRCRSTFSGPLYALALKTVHEHAIIMVWIASTSAVWRLCRNTSSVSGRDTLSRS